MATPFVRPHRIHFSECDPGGIVFYPQYFVLFNDLMEQWIDALLPSGFRGWVLDRRLGLPTVRLEAEFKAVSRMGDDVLLSLRPARIGGKSMQLQLACHGAGQDGNAVANGLRMAVLQTVVTTSLDSHAAIPIPDDLRAAITAVHA